MDLQPWSAAAASPMLASGAEPRCHYFHMGEIEGFAVSDGGILVPRPNSVPGASEFILRPLCCLLVRMPKTGDLVLIDAGLGANAKRAGQPMPTVGRLLQSLSAAGIAPKEIATVLISHIHPDHVDGLYDNEGVQTFPNASYHVCAEEQAFWSQNGLDLGWSSAPGALKAEMLASARRLFGFAADTLETFAAGQPAVPGIGTLPLPGHTPGQVGFVLSSGGERLLYTADAITTIENSIDAPERHNPFDLDPVLGVNTRRTLLDTLSEPGWRSFTPHFPWPNLGTVQSDNGRYAWKPAGSGELESGR